MGSSSGVADAIVFIDCNQGRPPRDPTVKTLIRSRAMKQAAIQRKRDGRYERLNMIQYPEWILGSQQQNEPTDVKDGNVALVTTVNETGGHTDEGDEDEAQTRIAIKRTALLEGSLRWRAGYKPRILTSFTTGNSSNYSLLHLTDPLTLHHLGVTTFSLFRPETTCFGHTLTSMPEYAKRRLLFFIPSLYGHFPALTYATDCVVVRLEQLIRSRGILSSERDILSLSYYTKAIEALQGIIDDEDLRALPETLCAVLLLEFFELLHGGPLIDSWIYHAAGAARLIELRGPHNFRTRFELSLFMAHAGPIITEAILMGKRCFLCDDERWLNVLYDAIRNDPVVPPDQVHLVVELWTSLTNIPNLLLDVKDLIRMSVSAGRRQGLITRLLTERDHLQRWLALAEQYQCGIISGKLSTSADGASTLLLYSTVREQPVSWKVLIGTYIFVLLAQLRLLFSLSPSQFSELESTCQTVADTVLLMITDWDSYQNDRLVGGIFMSQALWMAKAILKTRLLE
ncbi:hypothetical protein H0G86_010399 [Trichoderma simmonsii]|uniref:Uncharacterized protein n=1 Tax=Trichoderma simmonsii TaxID=1491479 RepID=A0A8G0PI62_9HYPO|nr:hypothetical protein H0G86_010399 [Trichoderma simmonsii]